jgi:protoporphyrinogen oxidase
MDHKKVKYLILGAGVSGISAANYLGKNEDYLILEKTGAVGGYLKTIHQDGFTWDYSGHFFHFQSSEVKELIMKNINPDEILKISKKAGVLYKDRIVSFPFQKNISELPKDEFLECLSDFYFRKSKDGYDNFLDWLYGTLGESIVEKFVKPYNEKLYAVNLLELDVNAMGRFFPNITMEEMMKSLKIKNNDSYNSEFIYPRKGAISYIESLLCGVDAKKIELNTEALRIDTERRIVYSNRGQIEYETIISSMPLTNLLHRCDIKYNTSKYSSNKVLVFNFGFDKPTALDYHWLYVPDPKISFYRVGFYNNILGEFKMSLYVEIGLKSDQEIDIKLLRENVLKELKILNIVEDHKVISEAHVLMDPAYVHVNEFSIKDSLKKINLLKQKNIFSIGRYGEWTYCSIEDNIISAKKCVDELLNQKN